MCIRMQQTWQYLAKFGNLPLVCRKIIPRLTFSSTTQARKNTQFQLRPFPTDGNVKSNTVLASAGVFPERKILTEDGFEQTWAVNVLAPFLLTSLLVKSVKERIVNVSSISAGSRIDFDNLNQVGRHSYGHDGLQDSRHTRPIDWSGVHTHYEYRPSILPYNGG